MIADAASGHIVGEVHVDTALIDHAALERMNSEGAGRDPKRLIGARYGTSEINSIPWCL